MTGWREWLPCKNSGIRLYLFLYQKVLISAEGLLEKEMKIIGVIPARYESSRFPGKPLALIKGKPMVAWVYERASMVSEIDEIYVATDDERIMDCCREHGMKCMMTSKDHRTGADRVAEVASRTDGDIYLNIQGDEPLIDPDEIRQVIHILDDETVEYAALRQRIKDESEFTNPNVVKAVIDLSGNALYLTRCAAPYAFDAGLATGWHLVGLYSYRRQFLLDFLSWGQSDLEKAEKGIECNRALEHGRSLRLEETSFTTFGVDLPEQIAEVEAIMDRQGL